MTKAKPAKKPAKPYEDYPLFAHDNGQWAKKIRGKLHYFGKWSEPDEALDAYLQDRDYLHSGKTPPSRDGHTILEVCDRFLIKRQHDVTAGELAQRTYDDYKRACDTLTDLGGSMTIETMKPEDWAKLRADLCKDVGTTTAANRIRIARIALRYLDEIAQVMPRWGKNFSEPSQRTKRKARIEAGERMHTPDQIRAAIEGANEQFGAMILLGINCAFGNNDCASIEWKHIDLDKGWHTFHRPKTYIERKAKLWPETVEALRKVLPEEGSSPVLGRVFTTKYGNIWRGTAVSHEAHKLGIEFYNLRRTFRTISDEIQDTKAIRLVMGHTASASDMDARYTQRISDDRLERVANHVRAWLYPQHQQKPNEAKPRAAKKKKPQPKK